MSEAKLTFVVDADDRFLSASPAWDQFAAENEAAELDASSLLGRPVYEFIADAETRELQRLILAQVRASPASIRYRIRCDSPRELRLLELVISRLDGGAVRTESTLLNSEPQDSGRLLERHVEREGSLVLICGWCLRVSLAGDWVSPAEAARELGLFEAGPVPPLTHGICENCYERMTALIAG